MKKSEKDKGKQRAAVQKNQILTVLGGAIIALIIITAVWYFAFNTSGAKSGDTVSVYYTGMLKDGTVFDANVNGTPLVFTIGQGRVITGMEEGVIGMQPGSTKTLQIPVDKAYGPYQQSLVHVVNRSTLPEDVDFRVGERYTVSRSSDGAVAIVKVINITGSTMTWDENHELAGKDLIYNVTLVGITP